MFWMGPGWLFNPATADGAFDYVTELSTRLREARINLWSATEWPYYDSSGQPLPVTDLIYKDAIERLTPKKVTFSSLALRAIAMQTGGGMLETHNDLAGLLSKHVGEASAFYSLTFDPPRTNQMDEYHALKLELGNPDLTAHTNAGYFDEPVFYDQSPAGIERVTVEQLEHALSALDGSSDAEIAQHLSSMELSERLNTARLATLQATLRGKKAREALVALADESAFLAPPSGEIPNHAARLGHATADNVANSRLCEKDHFQTPEFFFQPDDGPVSRISAKTTPDLEDRDRRSVFASGQDVQCINALPRRQRGCERRDYQRKAA